MTPSKTSTPPPPPVSAPPGAPPQAAAAPAQAEAEAGSENRAGSVPPPPPRRRTAETPAVVINQNAAEITPAVAAHRPGPAELPVIPKLDIPRVGSEAGDGSTTAPTIPPARSTTIRSPSEVLQSRSSPALSAAPEASAWSNALSRISDFGGTARDRLPESIRTALEETTPGVLWGGSAMVGVVLISVAGAIHGLATRGSSSSTPVAAVGSATTPSESAAAAPAEPALTSAPAAKAPNPAASDEATILLDLSESMLTQRRDADAVPPLERLITRHPELKNNEQLGRLLLAAAASNDKVAASKAHTLLTGPMGEAGAALIYELSLKPDTRDAVRQRARTWLASKDFDRTASLPVYAAVRLRNAASCEDKRALLDFAGRAGGKYVLSYLKEIEQKKSCEPDDMEHCFPCMRSDPRLSQTIAKLETH